MTSEGQFIPVHVEVLSFASLFNESAFPLAVDTYQRGFVWKDDKVRQLADDLSAYQQEADSKPPYYMGTVLIHRHADKEKRFLIDGQQRITALCLLHWQLNSSLPTNCALSYSPKSARRIPGERVLRGAGGQRQRVLQLAAPARGWSWPLRPWPTPQR